MSALRKTFRLWWQPPRKVTEVEEDRSVSFLELFYDLAYVVIVAQLTHTLVRHPTMVGFLGFVALFTLVWWAWVNGSYYHELHGNYDIRTRVFTFLQMFALFGMAIFAPTALGTGASGFSLSYAAFLGLITWLWWRTGVHDEKHRPVSQPYTLGFILTTGIFVISAFTTAPQTYYLWALGILLSLLTPLIFLKYQQRLDANQLEAAQQVRASLVERFGLLTIIMLGEVIVAVVSGVLHHDVVSLALVLNAALGLGIAMALWWIYFDFASHHVPIQQTLPRFSWLYLHLPLTMGIALTGAGLLALLEHNTTGFLHGEQWFLLGPIALVLFTVALLVQTLDIDASHTEIHHQGGLGSVGSGVAMLALGFLALPATWLLVAISVLLVAPIMIAVRMWVKGLQRAHS